MSEESNLLGNDNEKFAKLFFEKICKWEYIVSNFDLKKKGGGIDHVFKCFDPFINKTTNILVECKYRADNHTINKKSIGEMVSILKKKISIAENSPTWNETEYYDKIKSSKFRFGSIFLKMKKYNHQKYCKDLQGVPLIKNEISNPPVISIITNYRISKIVEVVQNKKNLQFFYPVYAMNNDPTHKDYLSFTYLFSDIIVGKYDKKVNESGDEKEISVYFVISFEKPSKSSVNYIRNAIKLWGIYKEVKEIYFTEGSNLNIQENKGYVNLDDNFMIKNIKGDIDCDFSMEDKIQ